MGRHKTTTISLRGKPNVTQCLQEECLQEERTHSFIGVNIYVVVIVIYVLCVCVCVRVALTETMDAKNGLTGHKKV